MTFFSTTGFEAALVDKPLLTVNLTGKNSPVPYAEYGIALEATEREQIGEKARKILRDEKTAAALREARERKRKDLFYLFDGRASERCAGIIEGIVKGKT